MMGIMIMIVFHTHYTHYLAILKSRLQLLHKIVNQDISLSIPPYYQSVERQTRHYDPLHYILPTPSTTSYQQSLPYCLSS